jgi:hypothetical protein
MKILLALLVWAPLSAQPASGLAAERLLDRILARERDVMELLAAHAPLFETYIQETAAHSEDGTSPLRDHYFLGRVRIQDGIHYESLIEKTHAAAETKGRLLRFGTGKPAPPPLVFLPKGFAQMAVIDLHGFTRLNYHLEYVRREFLGEVRVLVFDVSPLRPEPGRFLGRIWVEERQATIVRFNGTYQPAPRAKSGPAELYFHFDSWRTNPAPGVWVPSHIYVEEESATGLPARFKAQTRIWNFAPARPNPLSELTQILVEAGEGVHDPVGRRDISPLESQRAWERQAEENVLSRLEKGGFLAPPGPVDEVLNTVVDNLIISAKLPVQARCRVLLTTPIETFTIGRTIVISRGLIDVLPDETSLALVLADELAHIALGHRTPTQFAFYNQTMLSDAELLAQLRFERSARELEEAGAKTIEIMRASPYQATGSAGLFLKALASRRAALPRLLAANLGNQLANPRALERLAEFMANAPELEEDKLEQIAALPLGSRIKLNLWNGQITLAATKPLSLLSAREKMPFEIAPLVEYLTLAGEP